MSWVSLSVWRTRPSGAKSPPIIFGPLVSMTCEAAVADLADVKTLGEQRVEHRRGVGRDFLVAANQADAVALPDLFAGARHRRLEKSQFVADACAERRDAVRIAGRGDEHDLAGGGRDKRALDHIF